MKIFIKAKPKSKIEFIKKVDNLHYAVAVREMPVAGQANTAIIKALSIYFHKPHQQIFIVSGEKSKQKIIEVPVTSEELENQEVQKKLF